MLPIYSVVAYNCAYWQRLVTEAESPSAAAAQFRAFLAARESAEEYEMAVAVSEDAWGTGDAWGVDSRRFIYRFEDDDVELFDGYLSIARPLNGVRFLRGGANG